MRARASAEVVRLLVDMAPWLRLIPQRPLCRTLLVLTSGVLGASLLAAGLPGLTLAQDDELLAPYMDGEAMVDVMDDVDVTLLLRNRVAGLEANVDSIEEQLESQTVSGLRNRVKNNEAVLDDVVSQLADVRTRSTSWRTVSRNSTIAWPLSKRSFPGRSSRCRGVGSPVADDPRPGVSDRGPRSGAAQWRGSGSSGCRAGPQGAARNRLR